MRPLARVKLMGILNVTPDSFFDGGKYRCIEHALIQSEKMVKEGAVVIDAGTSVESGETMGDVDFESVEPKASYITPVPGGVGPLTVAHLLQNLVILSR